MRVEEITDAEGMEALRAEWSALWDRSPGATPFQSPEWLLPWWRHLGRGGLRFLAMREGDRLVGAAPLFIHRARGVPLRRLAWLGTGVSDYLGPLAEPSALPEVLARLEEYLERASPGWDLADFQQIPDGSPLLTLARGERALQEVCPVLTLPGGAGEAADPIPARMRAPLRQARARLAREQPGARLELASEASHAEILEALFRLHQARWNRRRLPGAFALARVRAFHREATAAFLARGWLRLHALRVGGAIGAALYCFTAGRRGYYYSGGFRDDLSRLSPGTLLIGAAIEEALRTGAVEFDFLRGEEPYKYRWDARPRQNHRILVWQPGFRGSVMAPRLLRWERKVEHALRRAAGRLARG